MARTTKPSKRRKKTPQPRSSAPMSPLLIGSTRLRAQALDDLAGLLRIEGNTQPPNALYLARKRTVP